jgi:hypothetical protein
MKTNLRTSLVVALLTLATTAWASDHDDGEIDAKGRALNLTDVYAFKESWQVSGGDPNALVLVMNSNPRSLPRQQYYFSTQAYYEFHVSRAGTAKDTPGTTQDDVILRFQFGEPNSNGVQKMTLTAIKGGASAGTDETGVTTALAATTPTANTLNLAGTPMTAFAGLREDPFFFDVTQFFKFRAALAANGGHAAPAAAENYPRAGTAVDFTANYNVNAIVVRLPVSFLQTSGETVFDLWATISIPE